MQTAPPHRVAGHLEKGNRMEDNTARGGIGFFGLLQIAFIVLKLCGVIDWAWWLVLLPIEIWAAFMLLCVLAAVILNIVDDVRGY